MPLWSQIITTFGVLIFAIITTSIAVYKIGWNNCAKKNGYVLEAVCEKRVNEIKTDFKDMKVYVKEDFEKLHEKVNLTNREISEMSGEMETQTTLLNKLLDK